MQAINENVPNKRRFAIHMCITLILSVLYLKSMPIEDVHLAASFGTSLGLSILAWLFFLIISDKYFRRNMKLKSFMILWVVLFFSQLILVQIHKNSVLKFRDEVVTLMTTISEEIQNPSNDRIQISQKSLLTGDLGLLETVIRKNVQTNINDAYKYKIELQGAGLEDMLGHNKLKSLKHSNQVIFILERSKEIVKKYKELSFQRLGEYEGELLSLKVSTPVQLAINDHLSPNSIENKELLKTIWNLETEVLLEIEKCYILLHSSKNSWEIRGENILFSDDNILQSYNSYINNINSLIKKQEEFQKLKITSFINQIK